MAGDSLKRYCERVADKHCEQDTIDTIKLYYRENANCARRNFAQLSKKYFQIDGKLSSAVINEVMGKGKHPFPEDNSIKPETILTLYHGTNDESLLECGLDAEIPHPRVFPGDYGQGIRGIFVSPEPEVSRRFGRFVYQVKVKAKFLRTAYKKRTLKESLSLDIPSNEPQAILIKSLPAKAFKKFQRFDFSTGKWVSW